MRHFNDMCAIMLVELGEQALVAKTDEEKFVISAQLDIVEALIVAVTKDLNERVLASRVATRPNDNARGIPPSHDD